MRRWQQSPNVAHLFITDHRTYQKTRDLVADIFGVINWLQLLAVQIYCTTRTNFDEKNREKSGDMFSGFMIGESMVIGVLKKVSYQNIVFFFKRIERSQMLCFRVLLCVWTNVIWRLMEQTTTQSFLKRIHFFKRTRFYVWKDVFVLWTLLLLINKVKFKHIVFCPVLCTVGSRRSRKYRK